MSTMQIISSSIAFLIGIGIGCWICFLLVRAFLRAVKANLEKSKGTLPNNSTGDAYPGEEDDIYHHYYSGYRGDL